MKNIKPLNHFDNYVDSTKTMTIHPKLKTIYSNSFPDDIHNLKNLIFYGPSGTGKYSQVLACISKYSPSCLKYEKRLTITSNKEDIVIKISDIHFEVDMSLLGCTSKVIWNEIYTQIMDVISARSEKTGIVVCKYFHNVHSELLETFYNYMQMQMNKNIGLKYILITEHISFIPNNILNSCKIIPVARPSLSAYKKLCFKPNLLSSRNDLTRITNIKSLQTGNMHSPMLAFFETMLSYICNEQIRFSQMRELLYDTLIYDFDVNELAWYLISELVKKKIISNENMSEILIETYKFLQLYNNNYRPIYHLENFAFMLVNIVIKKKENYT
jgi:Cdc6-like AAA superfamily ATPase